LAAQEVEELSRSCEVADLNIIFGATLKKAL